MNQQVGGMKKMDKQAKSRLGVFVLMAISILAIALAVNAGSDTHSTSLGIGNSDPTISNVESIANIDLTPGSTVDIYVLFNASDNNGYADLDDATAQAVLSKTGESSRTSSYIFKDLFMTKIIKKIFFLYSSIFNIDFISSLPKFLLLASTKKVLK